MIVQIDNLTATAIALPAPLNALLPEVDYIITAQFGPVTFESIKPSLSEISQEKQPVPHWLISPVPKAFADAFNSSTKVKEQLSMLQPQNVMVTELVEAALKEVNQANEVKLMQGAATAYSKAQFKEALDLCGQIKGDYASMALMLRGVAKGELAMYDECFTDLAEYLKSDGENELVLNVYGYFLCSQNKKTEGEKAYTKAIEILDSKLQEAPENFELWSRKAYGLLGLNRPQEALSAAEKGIELNDKNALLLQHRGCAHMNLDQYKEAMIWLQRSVALDELNPYASFYLSKALTQLGDHENAKQYSNYVKKVSPHLSKTL
jgi:tetratricopeptide (TPR) repeat protein